MGRPKITIEEFKKRIKERFPDEDFEVLEYDSLGKPATLKCCNCGKEISVSKATNFMIPTKAYGCVNCNELWIKQEKLLMQLKERYDIIDTFVKNTHTYYHVRCKNCGHERTTDLGNFKKHLDCGCVTNIYRGRTKEEFLQQVNSNCKYDGEYELISEYENQTTKVLLRHIPCGFIWKVRPSDVVNGRSYCPKCGRTQSSGERLVSTLLEKYNIRFESEKRLNNSYQRFDFYIETENQKVAIEYNGEQHYEEVPFFHGTLAERQNNNARKRQYCKDNDIEMIELPYTYSTEQIEDIIKNLANRLNDQSKDVGASVPKRCLS